MTTHRELRGDPTFASLLHTSSKGPLASLAADESAAVMPADESWACTICTLANPMAAERCLACSCRRPAKLTWRPTMATGREAASDAGASESVYSDSDSEDVEVGGDALEASEARNLCEAWPGQRRGSKSQKRAGPLPEAWRQQEASLAGSLVPGSSGEATASPHGVCFGRQPLLVDAACKACHGVHVAHTCDPAARKKVITERIFTQRVRDDGAISLEDAERIASAEGLTLVHASPAYGCAQQTTTGFYGVHTNRKRSRHRFVAAVKSNTSGGTREHVHIGSFVTEAAAALGVARYLGPDGSRQKALKVARKTSAAAAAQVIMSEEEARRLAAAEGLVLVPSTSSSTGFRGVMAGGTNGRFNVIKYSKDGERHHIGQYGSAAEAALAYARSLTPDELAAALRKQETRRSQPMTLEEAQRFAEDEGLGELCRNDRAASGFMGVRETHSGKGSTDRPFEANIRMGPSSEQVYLGCFASAPEAALARARAAASKRMSK